MNDDLLRSNLKTPEETFYGSNIRRPPTQINGVLVHCVTIRGYQDLSDF